MACCLFWTMSNFVKNIFSWVILGSSLLLSWVFRSLCNRRLNWLTLTLCCDNLCTRLQKPSLSRKSWQHCCHLGWFIQTSKPNLLLKNLLKEGNYFTQSNPRWSTFTLKLGWLVVCVKPCVTLTLCPCCCVSVVCLSLSCLYCVWPTHMHIHKWCMNMSRMNAFPSLCACATLLWCVSSCPLCICVCVSHSQPPIEGRPPLLIRDVHRDRQFRRHDLRSQHQRPQLLRGGGPELRRRWRWWLWLRRWGQTERQKHWYKAS